LAEAERNPCMPRLRFGWGGLEDDVQVVGHDEKSVHPPGTAKRGSTEVFLNSIAVDVIAHDVLTAVAAGHEMVDSAGVLEAYASWHAIDGNILAVRWQKKLGSRSSDTAKPPCLRCE
jgi:hypothetical protein